MNGLSLTCTVMLLLFTAVDSRRKEAHKTVGRYRYHRYVKRDSDCTSQSREVERINRKELGKLDLRGNLRETFAYVALSNTSVSVICSPYSAMMPLGMLLFGADRHARNELLQATGVTDKSKAKSYFKGLRSKMKQFSSVKLYLASKIYVSKDKALNSNYKHDTESTFGPCVESVDMKDAVKTAAIVNEWAKESTKKKIKRVITDKEITPLTFVLIADAIYFEAKWKDKFTRTYLQPFYGTNGKIDVDLMDKRAHYMYGKSSALAAQAILIPYQGDEAAMLVVLPEATDGLNLMLRQLQLAPNLINEFEMKNTYVHLQLPKFKIETKLNLKELYDKVGVKEIFTKGLDGVVKGKKIGVDKALQKAIIDVNEIGTIAAAVSIVSGVGSSMPEAIFKADHPFLFFIIAKEEQIFAGTFVG